MDFKMLEHLISATKALFGIAFATIVVGTAIVLAKSCLNQ